ncbi:hypothetical protein PCE1_001658 [Barthelona sp. PCE]
MILYECLSSIKTFLETSNIVEIGLLRDFILSLRSQTVPLSKECLELFTSITDVAFQISDSFFVEIVFRLLFLQLKTSQTTLIPLIHQLYHLRPFSLALIDIENSNDLCKRLLFLVSRYSNKIIAWFLCIIVASKQFDNFNLLNMFPSSVFAEMDSTFILWALRQHMPATAPSPVGVIERTKRAKAFSWLDTLECGAVLDYLPSLIVMGYVPSPYRRTKLLEEATISDHPLLPSLLLRFYDEPMTEEELSFFEWQPTLLQITSPVMKNFERLKESKPIVQMLLSTNAEDVVDIKQILMIERLLIATRLDESMQETIGQLHQLLATLPLDPAKVQHFLNVDSQLLAVEVPSSEQPTLVLEQSTPPTAVANTPVSIVTEMEDSMMSLVTMALDSCSPCSPSSEKGVTDLISSFVEKLPPQSHRKRPKSFRRMESAHPQNASPDEIFITKSCTTANIIGQLRRCTYGIQKEAFYAARLINNEESMHSLRVVLRRVTTKFKFKVVDALVGLVCAIAAAGVTFDTHFSNALSGLAFITLFHETKVSGQLLSCVKDNVSDIALFPAVRVKNSSSLGAMIFCRSFLDICRKLRVLPSRESLSRICSVILDLLSLKQSGAPTLCTSFAEFLIENHEQWNEDIAQVLYTYALHIVSEYDISDPSLRMMEDMVGFPTAFSLSHKNAAVLHVHLAWLLSQVYADVVVTLQFFYSSALMTVLFELSDEHTSVHPPSFAKSNLSVDSAACRNHAAYWLLTGLVQFDPSLTSSDAVRPNVSHYLRYLLSKSDVDLSPLGKIDIGVRLFFFSIACGYHRSFEKHLFEYFEAFYKFSEDLKTPFVSFSSDFRLKTIGRAFSIVISELEPYHESVPANKIASNQLSTLNRLTIRRHLTSTPNALKHESKSRAEPVRKKMQAILAFFVHSHKRHIMQLFGHGGDLGLLMDFIDKSEKTVVDCPGLTDFMMVIDSLQILNIKLPVRDDIPALSRNGLTTIAKRRKEMETVNAKVVRVAAQFSVQDMIDLCKNTHVGHLHRLVITERVGGTVADDTLKDKLFIFAPLIREHFLCVHKTGYHILRPVCDSFLLGRIMALYVETQINLGIEWPSELYGLLCGLSFHPEDVLPFDPELHIRMDWVDNNDLAELGLRFEDGTPVSDLNKKRYIMQFSLKRFTDFFHDYELLVRGFRSELQSVPLLPTELSSVLNIQDGFDIEKLMDMCVVDASLCSNKENVQTRVDWIHRFMYESDFVMRNTLLRFITGSTLVPVTGWRLHLTDAKNRLPESRICTNALILSDFEDYDSFYQHMMIALVDCQGMQL